MKQSSSTFRSKPHVARSIVNSVTEDEDDYNHRNELKENIRPTGDFRLPPLPLAPLSSYTEPHMTKMPQPLSQNTGQPTKYTDLSFGRSVLPPPLQEPMTDAQLYLTRYERMMNEQEHELSLTLSHLQPLFELLEHVARPHFLFSDVRSIKTRLNLSQEFSTRDLQRALIILEDDSRYEAVKTEKQFMMTLRTFCGVDVASRDSLTQRQVNRNVSLGEILLCYRLSIIGMQTLELLPSGSSARDSAKERTLQMLSLFRPSTITKGVPLEKNATKEKGYLSQSCLLFIVLVAGAFALSTLLSFVDPSTLSSFGVTLKQRFPVHESASEPTIVSPETKDDKITARNTNSTTILRTAPSSTSLERQITIPVLTPIEKLRSNSISDPTKQPLAAEKKDLLTVNQSDIITLTKENFKTSDDVVTFFGGTAAGLYLLLPLLASGPSWLTIGVTFLVTSLGGENIRGWAKEVKGAFSKPKNQTA